MVFDRFSKMNLASILLLYKCTETNTSPQMQLCDLLFSQKCPLRKVMSQRLVPIAEISITRLCHMAQLIHSPTTDTQTLSSYSVFVLKCWFDHS